MSWKKYEDGLKLDGVHFDQQRVDDLIEQLSHAKNCPRTICRLLRDGLRQGFLSRSVIWRLSKWCHWPHWSEGVAQEIAQLLFGEVPPRFLDEQNRPYADAVANYMQFRNSVAARQFDAGVPA